MTRVKMNYPDRWFNSECPNNKILPFASIAWGVIYPAFRFVASLKPPPVFHARNYSKNRSQRLAHSPRRSIRHDDKPHHILALDEANYLDRRGDCPARDFGLRRQRTSFLARPGRSGNRFDDKPVAGQFRPDRQRLRRRKQESSRWLEGNPPARPASRRRRLPGQKKPNYRPTGRRRCRSRAEPGAGLARRGAGYTPKRAGRIRE